jgi:hypothetical protein
MLHIFTASALTERLSFCSVYYKSRVLDLIIY